MLDKFYITRIACNPFQFFDRHFGIENHVTHIIDTESRQILRRKKRL